MSWTEHSLVEETSGVLTTLVVLEEEHTVATVTAFVHADTFTNDLARSTTEAVLLLDLRKKEGASALGVSKAKGIELLGAFRSVSIKGKFLFVICGLLLCRLDAQGSLSRDGHIAWEL